MADNTLDTTGVRIYKLRNQLDLTQKEFADSIGVSQSSVNYWENGNREPKMRHLQKISTVYNIPIQTLLGLSQKHDHVIHEDNKFWFIFSDSEDLEVNKDAMMASIPEILKQYNKLNDAGKQKALEYTTDLAQMEKYLKNPGTKK